MVRGAATIATIAGLVLLICFDAASAQNTGGVFGPVVNDGHRSLQYRIAHDPDIGGFAHRLHFQQALNGETMWRIIAQGRERDVSGHSFDFVQGELFWQLSPDSARWQRGLRFDLRLRDGDRPGTAGLNWTNQFPLGNTWTARALLLTAIEVGENRRQGVLLQTRGQLARRVGADAAGGLQLFSAYGSTDDFPELDQQLHQIGPFLSLGLGDGFGVFGRALFGLTDASPDAEFTLWLTKAF